MGNVKTFFCKTTEIPKRTFNGQKLNASIFPIHRSIFPLNLRSVRAIAYVRRLKSPLRKEFIRKNDFFLVNGDCNKHHIFGEIGEGFWLASSACARKDLHNSYNYPKDSFFDLQCKIMYFQVTPEFSNFSFEFRPVFPRRADDRKDVSGRIRHSRGSSSG